MRRSAAWIPLLKGTKIIATRCTFTASASTITRPASPASKTAKLFFLRCKILHALFPHFQLYKDGVAAVLAVHHELLLLPPGQVDRGGILNAAEGAGKGDGVVEHGAS